MSLLLVGASYQDSSIELLERLALERADALTLASTLVDSGTVREAVVLSTCNRVEVYAEVESFHEGADGVRAALLGDHDELAEVLVTKHGEGVAQHLFEVASGLRSMSAGESQILGQVRSALVAAQGEGTVGKTLNPLFQAALRAGKRVHSETGVQGMSRSLLEAALDAQHGGTPLEQAHVLVLGAGSMGSLVASTVAARGVAGITVVNRSIERARSLARTHGGGAVALDDQEAVRRALALSDVVVSAIGSGGWVLPRGLMSSAREERSSPQLLIDLALPRDIDPGVGELDGVSLMSLVEIRALLDGGGDEPAPLAEARRVLEEELSRYLERVRVLEVAPTIKALRLLADDVVEAEVKRVRGEFKGRDPELLEASERALRRVVEKLLHNPTVRVKDLAQGEADYAEVLRELFALEVLGLE